MTYPYSLPLTNQSPLQALTEAKCSNMAYENNGTPSPTQVVRTGAEIFSRAAHTQTHSFPKDQEHKHDVTCLPCVFTHHLVTVFAFDGNGAVFAVAGLATVACHHCHVCTRYTQQT